MTERIRAKYMLAFHALITFIFLLGASELALMGRIWNSTCALSETMFPSGCVISVSFVGSLIGYCRKNYFVSRSGLGLCILFLLICVVFYGIEYLYVLFLYAVIMTPVLLISALGY